MQVSTKGRYALRLMLDLAVHDTGENISLKSIAQRQEISEKYLEQIIGILTKAGFVRSMRGAGGGYRLARAAGSYTVGSILRLTEGSLAPGVVRRRRRSRLQPCRKLRNHDCMERNQRCNQRRRRPDYLG